MLLSVSRRTDIPALYAPWFFNRLNEHYVLVRNPMNLHQISRVTLSPELIDCIIFWTKNPAPMLLRLKELKDYMFYFQFTITPYGQELEPALPDKKMLMETCRQLAARIGPERIIWRYDPILFTPRYTPEFHQQAFAGLAEGLCDSTRHCIFSFLDLYQKTGHNMRGQGLFFPPRSRLTALAQELAKTAKRYAMKLSCCSEPLDLQPFGIGPARCIDPHLISQLLGEEINVPKDTSQRAECACAASIDIGAYHTCSQSCLYCYANDTPELARKNAALHDPSAPLLFGQPGPSDRITDRKMHCWRHGQISLF